MVDLIRSPENQFRPPDYGGWAENRDTLEIIAVQGES